MLDRKVFEVGHKGRRCWNEEGRGLSRKEGGLGPGSSGGAWASVGQLPMALFFIVLCFVLFATVFVGRGVARAAVGDNTVGMNTHIPAEPVSDLVVDMGVPWIRVDNNWFNHTDPCSGSMSFFSALDTRVQYALSQGLCVYMTLAYTPACASLGDSDGKNSNDVPDPALYGSYVRQSVAHYRAMGVRHFGLWNEANLEGFFEGSAADYVDNILVPGFAAVENGCADAGYGDCLVLGPDLAHVGEYDVFLEDTLNAMTTAGLVFDIFTHHIYQDFDTQVWEGDSFINALEDRRYSFTRRSLMDVLTDTGYAQNGVPSFEVWITETGHHCDPPIDAGEMDYQEYHYQETMDAQLARDWWTNTFFYEILDSGDELDGFGITRDQGGGSFLLKPAYTYLQGKVATTPSLGIGGCEVECSDGVDNDGDGATDLQDPGCSGLDDDDESDDPEVKEAVAEYNDAVTVDGDLSEWESAEFVELSCAEDYISLGSGCTGEDDLSARFAFQWHEGALYLAVEVTDENARNENDAELLWAGDSVQAAFDMGENGGEGYDDTDDYEYGWALTSTGEASQRWHAPAAADPPGETFSVSRSGVTTIYEVRLDPGDLGQSAWVQGLSFAFSLVCNDDDGQGREGFVQWTGGIAQTKSPSLFGTVTLQGGSPAGDGGVSADGGGTGQDGGGQPGVDAASRDGGPGADGGASHASGSSNGGCGCRLDGRGRSRAGGALGGSGRFLFFLSILVPFASLGGRRRWRLGRREEGALPCQRRRLETEQKQEPEE